ncbi:hypothetical protein AXG93_328s1040 [Marchantia polymorpha subsp. ruderalis]|uniref:Uncharacterized protein n=1 Tax=Marchantia polymorpha subsp. ruderalis TaxID=1480154 RepID=A0A176VQT8_MARPO|nr:hypothetical protein AXG93_328s1040 [Marchantia polymorpha subsp. ruderalis]
MEHVVEQIGGTVMESPEILSSQVSSGLAKPKADKRSSEEDLKEFAFTFSDFLHDSVVSFIEVLGWEVEEVREEQLRAKDVECEVLRLNLAKEKKLRAEEELRTKVLRREIATMKTERMELQGRIGAQTEAQNKEMQRANELMASLAEETKKHEAELASWTTKLTECETARAEAAELTFEQLKEETTDNLRLQVEKFLRGFVMWKVQTLKWMKLDSLERQLMGFKTSGTVGQHHLVRLVNSFSSELEEARENLEILDVLHRLGADGISEDVVTVMSNGFASESNSSRPVELSRNSE